MSLDTSQKEERGNFMYGKRNKDTFRNTLYYGICKFPHKISSGPHIAVIKINKKYVSTFKLNSS